MYQSYGDLEFLKSHYEHMARFVDSYEKRSRPGPLPPERFHAFGDWLNVRADTPKDVIYMAYFAQSTRLLAQAAELLRGDYSVALFLSVLRRNPGLLRTGARKFFDIAMQRLGRATPVTDAEVSASA